MALAASAFSASNSSSEIVHLTLDQSVQKALEFSIGIKAEKNQSLKAFHQWRSRKARLWPQISLLGSYKYVDVIPAVRIGSNQLSLGYRNNYSLGPELSYSLFDGGQLRSFSESAEEIYKHTLYKMDSVRKNVVLATRRAYVKAQLAQAKLALAKKSYALAKTQFMDVGVRHRSGAASRVDYLAAHSEVTRYHIQEIRAEQELSIVVVELNSLLGEFREQGARVTYSVDPLELAVKDLAVSLAFEGSVDHHPDLLSDDHLISSFKWSVGGRRAAFLPQIRLFARTSLDYPNGPIDEQINQNIFGVNLNWTIWDWGSIDEEKQEAQAQFESAQNLREQKRLNLLRDLNKSRTLMTSLLNQKTEVEKLVRESTELAGLNFSAYRYGKLKFADVQNANLQRLETEKQLAELQGEILTQYYFVQFLLSQGSELEN